MSDIVIQPYVSAPTVDLANFIFKALKDMPSNYTLAYQDLISIISNFSQTNDVVTLQLSDVRPDFESIKQQFQSELSKRDSWKDIIQSGGGATVLDFISSVGAYGQSGIFNALQEANLDTAVLTSSIYSIMRMLGVHIRRKIPAKVTVKLYNSSTIPIVVPTLTQFIVGDKSFFNRLSIIIPSGSEPIEADLYQGTVSYDAIISNGYPYQRFELGENQFDVSDQDVYAFQINGTTWTSITDGLYNYGPTDKVFYSQSTPEGNVEILLGNNIYGKIPPTGEILAFTFVTTDGDISNSSTINGFVNISGFNPYVPDRTQLSTDESTQTQMDLIKSSITGESITIIDGGAAAKDKNHYQAVGPFLSSGKKGMIRKSEHYAVGLEFPGISDVLFRNQKDVAPYNRNLINVVYVTPLMTNSVPMTATQWNDFVAFLNTRQIWRVDWVLIQPNAVLIDVEANIYCNKNSDITNIGTFAEFNVKRKLSIQRGSLGRSLLKSDFDSMLKLNYKNLQVDYYDLINPVSSFYVNNTDYILLNSLKINPYYSTRNYQNTVNFNTPEDYTVLS